MSEVISKGNLDTYLKEYLTEEQIKELFEKIEDNGDWM